MVAIEAVKWEILFQLVSSCSVVLGATSKQKKKKLTKTICLIFQLLHSKFYDGMFKSSLLSSEITESMNISS